jgi:hypothetical protein
MIAGRRLKATPRDLKTFDRQPVSRTRSGALE